MIDTTEGPVVRAALRVDRRAAGAQLGQPRGRRRRRHPARHLPPPRPGVRRGGRLHLHRRGGPGPHRRVEGAGGPGDPRRRGRPLRARAEDLLFDPLALPLSTGMEESRRDGIETIEGIRRIKAELPGVHTILGLSNVSFGLNPAARQVLNSVFLHECVEAGLDAAIVHASKILPLARIDERAREVCLDLIYDRRRDGYDPLQELLGAVRGRRRRRPGRPTSTSTGRSSGGSSSGSSTATATASRPTSTRRSAGGHAALDIVNDILAGRDEDGRRPLRLRRDAAALRAPVGRDDEGGRRLPRAAHGAGRPGRQGHDRARHRQGRRPRHRQEPRRHHPHQQRLRGRQPRHQGRRSPR